MLRLCSVALGSAVDAEAGGAQQLAETEVAWLVGSPRTVSRMMSSDPSNTWAADSSLIEHLFWTTQTGTVVLAKVIRGFGCSQWSRCRFASPSFVVQAYGLYIASNCGHA